MDKKHVQGGRIMRAIYLGDNHGAYGFTYKELTQLDYAIDELIQYWDMWKNDDRECVRKDALKEIDFLAQLGQKIEYYRNRALSIKEEQEDSE